MARHRYLRVLISAALALAVFVPSAQAGSVSRTTTTRYILDAYSANCQYAYQPGCVNVNATVTWEPAVRAGEICVSVADNRDVAPPVANGCADLGAASTTLKSGRSLRVARLAVPGVHADDCERAEPEENCVPRSVTLGVSASFVASGGPVPFAASRRTTAGSCVTTTTVMGTRTNVTGQVSVDGVAYDLPGTDPTAHRRGATLTYEKVRETTVCS